MVNYQKKMILLLYNYHFDLMKAILKQLQTDLSILKHNLSAQHVGLLHQNVAQCCAKIQPSFSCTNSLFGFSMAS